MNFFVLLYSKASQTRRVYEVSAGAWTQRSSVAVTITAGVNFSMGANLRAGLAQDWAGTVPAGQIGLWSSHGTANTFDNFSIRDVAGPFEVDGRWFCEHGEVQVDAANSNVLEVTSSNSFHMHVIRRGMRAGKYVATARFKWNASAHPGLAARWIGPSDSAYVAISPADGKARLFLRESGAGTTLSTSGTVLSLTTNNWYTMKLVIGDDLANSALQRLRFWVDTDDDGDWSDETALLDSTAIDDEWSAGSVGFYRGGAAAQQYDTFRAGYDNNADLDIDDGGDDVLISDDFATSVISPTYDNNGNNTGDGLYTYTFDGWNRRRLTKLGAEGDALTVQEFAWYPTGRMATRANTNLGVENTAKDGGNITVRHYFAGKTLVEERNGSAQATRQYLWSSGQLVWMDTNGDPSIGNDTSPDLSASGEGSESPADKRHFYTYNAQHRIVALTDYTAGGGGNNGRIAERYAYAHRVEPIVLAGDGGSGELGNSLLISRYGGLATQYLRTNAAVDQLESASDGISTPADPGIFPIPMFDPSAPTDSSKGGIGELPFAEMPIPGVTCRTVCYTFATVISNVTLTNLNNGIFDGCWPLTAETVERYAPYSSNCAELPCLPGFACIPIRSNQVAFRDQRRLCVWINTSVATLVRQRWGLRPFRGADCRVCFDLETLLVIQTTTGVCLPPIH